MQTMAFGILAAIALLISICCLYCKKTLSGLIFATISMALTCQTGYHWRSMLVDSGKDTTLLGFQRYPVALIILCILSFLAAISIILSIVKLMKTKWLR